MIIDDIVEKTKIRLEREMSLISRDEMHEKALSCKIDESFPFEEALRKPGVSFILEAKKASPSKGLIEKDFHPVEIAKMYEEIGADCMSVLTEPDFFMGDIEYLYEISKSVSLPLLRKDFIIDTYMIDQAKVNGASCVLLIVSILKEKLKDYISYASSLGLSALVEAHDEEEVLLAIDAGARIIGVNNRDLRDFSVDIHNSLRYRHLIPENVLFVSESGIFERSQIIELEENHVNAVLIGETLMKAKDKGKMLRMLKGEE